MIDRSYRKRDGGGGRGRNYPPPCINDDHRVGGMVQ